jgi:hypothetical protein
VVNEIVGGRWFNAAASRPEKAAEFDCSGQRSPTANGQRSSTANGQRRALGRSEATLGLAFEYDSGSEVDLV